MKLRIEFNDGRREDLRVAPADLVAFERRFKMAAATIDTDPRIEYMLFLGFQAARRTMKIPTDWDFDRFVDELAALPDDADEGGPELPLGPPPPPESAPSPPSPASHRPSS